MKANVPNPVGVPLHDQVLQDLHWLVESPSLISEQAPGRFLNTQASLADVTCYDTDALHLKSAWDRAIDAVHRSLAWVTETANADHRRIRWRVGRYFEALVAAYLSCLRSATIREQNVVLRRSGRTLGELDFLFTDQDRALVHWEVAVKFYLHYPFENATGSHWIGPNPKDTLEKKLTRLFQHQLPLGRAERPDLMRQQALVKGRIFFHFGASSEISGCNELNPGCLKATWLWASEVPSLIAEFSDALSVQVHKPFWLSKLLIPTDSPDAANLTTLQSRTERIQMHFRGKGVPILLSLLHKPTDTSEVLEEFCRVFIVPDHWPGK